MRILPILATGFLLMAGTAPRPGADVTVTTRLGKTFNVGPTKITPMQVVADKRCPKDAPCVDAGEPLRLRVLVETPTGSHQRVLIEGVPQTITGGELLMSEATPLPDPVEGVEPGTYRFVLRYSER